MITPRNMTNSSKIHTMQWVMTAALDAGADLANIPIFRCPKNIKIVGAHIIPKATYTGHADGSVWAVKKGTTSIASATFNATAGSTPPAASASASLVLSTIEANLKASEGTVLLFSVTNGAGATTPICILQIDYIVDEVL